MRRRAFITLLVGSAAAWPRAARAQQPGKIPRIGFLGATTQALAAKNLERFRAGLRDLGYIEGENILIDFRWAEGNYARLAEYAVELVRLRVDETPAFQELQDLEAASTVPIREIIREPGGRRNTLLGLLSRWAEGSAFNTWGVFAITYATGALGLHRVSVLLVVTIAALVMAVLLPVSGALTDRFGARRERLVVLEQRWWMGVSGLLRRGSRRSGSPR